MTENKRYSFNWERGHPNFWDNYCDLADCYLTCEDVVELLNEQHEQIERLKRNFKALDEVKCELAEENEQLKEENKWLKSIHFANDVLKENEQLKKQIERIDFILDDLNGAEYISRDDGIKALNKIDKVIGKR